MRYELYSYLLGGESFENATIDAERNDHEAVLENIIRILHVDVSHDALVVGCGPENLECTKNKYLEKSHKKVDLSNTFLVTKLSL